MMLKDFFKLLLFLFFGFGSLSFSWSASDFFNDYTQYLFFEDDIFKTGGKYSFDSVEIKYGTNGTDSNFGISCNSYKYLKSFPTKISIGNLSIGGLYSKMKSPEIDSSPSGLSSCFSTASIFSSTLPEYSSYTNPFKIFFETGYEDDKYFIESAFINGFYNPSKKEIGFSTKVGFNIYNKINITNIWGVVSYSLAEYIPTSWYSDYDDLNYYREDDIFCFGSQLLTSFSTILKNNFSFYCYKTPNGKIETIYKNELKSDFYNFNISFATYFNTNQFIVNQNNEHLKPMTQLKGNIQYTLPFKFSSKENNSEFAAGLTIYGKIPATIFINDLKLGLSAQCKLPVFYLLSESFLDFKIDNKEKESELNNISIKNEISFNFFNCKTTFSLSSKLYYDYTTIFSNEKNKSQRKENLKLENENHNISLLFQFPKEIFSISSKYSFNYKNNNFHNKKIVFSINGNLNFRKIIFLLKINGEFCIY